MTVKSHRYLGCCVGLMTFILLSCIGNEHTQAPGGNQQICSILFVGNSYTSSNDLPGQVRMLAARQGHLPIVEIRSITSAGTSLRDHTRSVSTMETLGSGEWDVIILQGHSLEVLKDPYGFELSVRKMVENSRETGAEDFLLETWPRKPGAPEYSEEWSGGSPVEMQKRTSVVYTEVADKTESTVIPVGTEWIRFVLEVSETELYSTDGSHPSPSGSYLAACIIYSTVFGVDPVISGYRPMGVRRKDARRIRDYLNQEPNHD